jgi:hypothetical protein
MGGKAKLVKYVVGGVGRLVEKAFKTDQAIEKVVAPVLERSAIIERATRTPANVLTRSQVATTQTVIVNSVSRLMGRVVVEAPRVSRLERILGPSLHPRFERIVKPIRDRLEPRLEKFIRPSIAKVEATFERVISPVRKVIKPVVESYRFGRETINAYRAASKAGLGFRNVAVRQLIDPNLHVIYPLIRGVGILRQIAGANRTGITERALWTGYRVYIGSKIAGLGEDWIDRLRKILTTPPPLEPVPPGMASPFLPPRYEPVVTVPTVPSSPPTVPSSPPTTPILLRPRITPPVEPPPTIRRPVRGQ